MIYDDLEDKAIRRSVSIQKRLETGDFPVTAKSDPELRSRLDSFRKLEKVTGPQFEAAMSAVEATEARIRQAKLTGLPDTERRKLIESARVELIKSIEQQKSKRMMSLLEELDAMNKKHQRVKSGGSANPNAVFTRLLALQESDLRNRHTSETDALVNFTVALIPLDRAST